ncbi:MAG: porin [Proteobacteria bacterium]|nr:porin [Pseudomonadota bacterium]
MKKTLLATTALAFVAAHASAVDVELYGQVNKGLFGFDDGSNTDTVVIDNALSSTRFGFKGAQALDNGLTASVLFEGEMASNPSNGFVQSSTGTFNSTAATPGSNTPSFAERQARVGLSGAFGGVYLGQQSTAIDGALTQDLAGAQDVMSADYARIGGGLQFRSSAGAHPTTALTANSLTTTVGQNRADSVRYDSPIYAGFQGRASVAQGGDSELAAFYDGAYGDFKIKGAAGVQFVNSATTVATNQLTRQYTASVSVAHTSGLAATVAYSGQALDHKTAGADEAEGWYAKVGYAWDAYEVAADYGQSNHFGSATLNSDKVKAVGLGAQYNMGNGVSVAALYRNLDADVTGTPTESIDLYGVNMRVKF